MMNTIDNPAQHKELSMVIPTYNGEDFLSETLNSIVPQRMSEKVEVLLGDGRSSDKIGDVAKTFCTKYNNVELFEHAIIGANSVVTKDFPRNCIAAEIPVAVIKQMKCLFRCK